MLGKILAFGPYGYIKDAYNLFDGVIVVVRYVVVWATLFTLRNPGVLSSATPNLNLLSLVFIAT